MSNNDFYRCFYGMQGGDTPPLVIITLDLFSQREEKLKLWQPDVLSYISRHHVQFVLLSLPLLELLLMYSTVQLAFSRQVP